MTRLNKDGKKVDTHAAVEVHQGTGSIESVAFTCVGCGLYTPGQLDSPVGMWDGSCDKFKIKRMATSPKCDHAIPKEESP